MAYKYAGACCWGTLRPTSLLSEEMTEIKQWTTAFDGLDKLQFTTAAAKPEPKDGEVLVKILTVSLNYRDTEGEKFPAHQVCVADRM